MKGQVNDPKYQAAADQIAADAGSTGALSWCLQEDGSLTVVIYPGPKINRLLPPLPRLSLDQRERERSAAATVEVPAGEPNTIGTTVEPVKVMKLPVKSRSMKKGEGERRQAASPNPVDKSRRGKGK